jgi:hypothetical protein
MGNEVGTDDGVDHDDNTTGEREGREGRGYCWLVIHRNKHIMSVMDYLPNTLVSRSVTVTRYHKYARVGVKVA